MAMHEEHLELRPGGSAKAPTQRDASAQAQATGLTSVLSLFLLLLAFFILLNSIAQFEAQRTRAVLGSLAATFNVRDPQGESRTLGSFVGHLEATDELEREVTGLLRTLVGVGNFELIRTGNLLSTTLDNRLLFAEQGDATDTLVDLAEPAAALLTAVSDDIIVEMTAYGRPAGNRVAGARRRAIDDAAARASTVVRTFGEFGIEPRQLVAALEDGDPRQTRIEFRVLARNPATGGVR